MRKNEFVKFKAQAKTLTISALSNSKKDKTNKFSFFIHYLL